MTCFLTVFITNIILATAANVTASSQHGNATTFHPVDPGMNNGKFACAGRTEMLPRDTHSDWTDESMPICAHRKIKCGTWVQIRNTKNGKVAWCMVADRGPYGAINEDGEWVLKRPFDNHVEARYRSVIDLAPSVSKKLETRGFGKVELRWWPKHKPHHVKKKIEKLKAKFRADWF